MTARSPGPSAASILGWIRAVACAPLTVWVAFIAAHLVLGLLNLYAPGYPLGDVVSVYKFWSDQVVVAGYWVGIDSGWVYPVVAIVPMLAAQALYPVASELPAMAGTTSEPWLYASTWLALVFLLDLAAFGMLTRWGRARERIASAWWWVAFLLALGPIALGRIDSVTVPIALIGVLLIAMRPILATLVLTAAAWIKVWPGALVIAMVTVMTGRWRMLGAAAALSVGIIALALSFGSGLNVLSFVTQQTGRGLQAEAPVSTYWLWRAASGSADTRVYFDDALLTWQVRGPGAAQVSDLMTPLLLLAVAAVVIVALLARQRGVDPAVLLPPLALAVVTALIAFQKVGSPQFVSWLAVPVIFGLVMHRGGHSASFRVPAALVLVIGALTHILYPYLYGYLIGLFPVMLTIISVRNGLYFVLLAVAVRMMVTLPRYDRQVGRPPGRSDFDRVLTGDRGIR